MYTYQIKYTQSNFSIQFSERVKGTVNIFSNCSCVK